MYTFSRRAQLLSALALASFALGACKKKEDPTPAPEPQAAEPVSAEAKSAATQITADDLRAQITKFSGDEFEGRAPATPGDEKAREYLVEQLKAAGFEPGGADGSYQQKFDVVGIEAKMPKQWTF